MAVPSRVPFNPTGNDALDLSLYGHKWEFRGERVIRWSTSDGLAGEAWSESFTATADSDNPVLDALMQAVSVMGSYINVRFEYAGHFDDPEAAHDADSDINISYTGDADWTTSGLGYLPIDASPERYRGEAGDVVLGSTFAALPSFAPGSTGFLVLIHELGHSLGMKHAWENIPSNRPKLADLGLENWNRDWYTMTAYEDDHDHNIRQWEPASPMALDVIGLQYLYGENTSHNAGNDTHALEATDYYLTLWDAAGDDTISVANSSRAWTIHLPEASQGPGRHPLPQGPADSGRTPDSTAGHAYMSEEASLASPHTYYWLMGEYENVTGSAHGDTVYGSSANERFSLGDGDDYADGGGGNDYMDGGAGMDFAAYSGRSSEYTIAAVDGTGAHIVTGPDGRDEVINIERLRFEGNSGVALDVAAGDDAGIAGMAYRIYQAAFAREPDRGGLSFWIDQMDNGLDLVEVSARFIDSDEFRTLYGDAPTDGEFITAVYLNVLDREPDAEGYEWWLDQLANNPERTRQKVLADFSESPENVQNVLPFIEDGIHYDILVA